MIRIKPSGHAPRNIKILNREEKYAKLIRQEQCFLILTFGGCCWVLNLFQILCQKLFSVHKTKTVITKGFENELVTEKTFYLITVIKRVRFEESFF